MSFRHELWTRRDRAFECRIVGPSDTYTGRVPRGYLIGPADFNDDQGDLAFVFAANRRIAPSRHLLTSPTGDLLANFRTPMVTTPVDSRPRRIEDGDGQEIATLVPAEAGAKGLKSKTVTALTDGSHEITLGGATVGRLGSKIGEGPRSLGATSVRRMKELREVISGRNDAESLACEIVIEISIDPLVAAAILLYTRFVLSEGRTPI